MFVSQMSLHNVLVFFGRVWGWCWCIPVTTFSLSQGSVCCSTVFIIRIPIGQWLMGLGDFPGGTEPVWSTGSFFRYFFFRIYWKQKGDWSCQYKAWSFAGASRTNAWNTRCWFQVFFLYFDPYLGKISILTSIFFSWVETISIQKKHRILETVWLTGAMMGMICITPAFHHSSRSVMLPEWWLKGNLYTMWSIYGIFTHIWPHLVDFLYFFHGKCR